ncbi:hypothetical protein K933_14523 [Candidatus Halobonum tyrrellensis G22]|uniref:Uncharacterized protein n=1 Tax=Candidatus Halobonum tyrrellensis G22 TaxID=1324957 RepID=V4HHH9_9EURY|nr:hypothetical protein K933_14523 [Candidatus Halobonum tyrrellensis G22]
MPRRGPFGDRSDDCSVASDRAGVSSGRRDRPFEADHPANPDGCGLGLRVGIRRVTARETCDPAVVT